MVCDDTHTIRPTSLHERFKYPRVVDRGDGIDSVDEILGADKKFMPVMASAEPLVHVAGAPVDVDETMREYQRGIRRLALSLLRAMAEKLGLSRRHFDSGWAGSNSGVTSLHYLALESADAVPQSDGYSGQNQYVKSTVNGDDPVLRAKDSIGDLGASLRAYAHADGDTMLTLLCHDQVEGLQVLHRVRKHHVRVAPSKPGRGRRALPDAGGVRVVRRRADPAVQPIRRRRRGL